VTTTAPTPPRRRWLRRVLWSALLAVPLTIAAALYALLATEAGLRWSLARAPALLGVSLEVGRAQGRWLGEFTLTDLRYDDGAGVSVTIARLHGRLQPAALLHGELHVAALDLDTLTIVDSSAPQPNTPAQPLVLPTRLPLDVAIEALTLRDFTLRSTADAAPFTLARVEFSGAWRGDHVTIAKLDSERPETGPVQLTADARLQRDAVEIAQLALHGPGDLSLDGRLGIGAAASKLTLVGKALHWPLQGPPQVADLDLTLHVDGTLDAYRFDTEAHAAAYEHPLQLVAQGEGGRGELALASLQLTALPGADPALRDVQPAVISASGRVAWTPQVRADLTAFIVHLNPALVGSPVRGDVNGRIDSKTVLDDAGAPHAEFSAEFTRSMLRGLPFALHAAGEVDLRHVVLRALRLDAGGGRVDAQGQVAWTPHLAPTLKATLQRINPGVFAPGWPGALNGRIAVDGGDGAPIMFSAELANSTLRGYPLALSAAGNWAAPALNLDRFKLDSGSTTLEANGRATPPFALSGSLHSPDLAALLPGLSGRADAEFTLDGELAQPHLRSRGNGTALHYQDYGIASLRWSADLAPELDSHAELALRGLEVGVPITSIDVTANGREVWHHADVAVATERGDARIAFDGGYDRKRGEWGGVLAGLTLAPNDSATWRLVNGTGLLLGAQRRALEPACLRSDAGEVCFNLEQNVLANGTRFGWQIDNLLLAAFRPLLPPDLHVDGHLAGRGHFNFTGTDLADAEGDIRIGDVVVKVPDAPALRAQTASIRADQRDGRLHVHAGAEIDRARLDADAYAEPAATLAARPLSGEVAVDVPSLSFVTSLLPALRSVDGRLGGRLTLAGTLGAPRLGGEVALENGRARLVDAGITLSDAQLRVRGAGDGPLSVNGTVSSGGGAVVVDGRVEPFAHPLRAEITLKGNDFQVMSTREARAWIAPDLLLVRDADGVKLSGELRVPKAEITPKGLGGGGVEVSSDQVLVGVETPEKEPPAPIFVDVRLVLGDAVRFEGFGLKTRIEGAVAVNQQPQREALGRGELRLIDGRYKAYGQDLTLESGRLIFSGGPVTKPAVDLYATRHPRDDITVGVRVRGTLAKPELSLQSSPPLPREQQLSWLVLGRSLETTSTQDRSLVSSAALSLGLGGGDFLAGLLGKRVGLDQLTVGSATAGGSEVAASAQSIAGAQTGGTTVVDQSAQAAQLTLGKYLTPKLFVSYGVSLFQRGYSFKMLYTLGNGFKLSSESGTASGGDIIYTVDRGKRKPPKPAEPR